MTATPAFPSADHAIPTSYPLAGRAAARAGLSGPARIPRALLGGVFLSMYLTWRPVDLMFTYSDALFLLGAAILVFKAQLPTRPFGALTPLWLLSFCLFIGGLLVSSLVNGAPMRWLIVACQYCFAWVLLPSVLVGHGRDNNIRLIKALIAGVFCMELFAALVYFGYDGTPQEVNRLLGKDFVSGNRRVSAFVTDGNWNAAVIATTLMFVVYCGARRFLGLAATVAVAVVLILALVLSASFTGFMSSISGLAVFCAVAAVRPKIRTVLVVAAIAAIAVQSGYGLPRAFQNRVVGALTNADLAQAGSYTGRMGLIEEAWDMVDDNILVGVGVDRYRVISSQRAPVHNLYLLVWAEGGLPALLGWLGMLATIAAAAMVTYRFDRIAAGLTMSVLWILVIFSAANPHMYNRMWAVPMVLALAVAFEAISTGGRGPTLGRKRDRGRLAGYG